MNILIVNYSQTGNTAKVAQAIYEEVLSKGHSVDMVDLAEIESDSLNSYDLVFLGSACHDAGLAQPVLRILEGIVTLPPFKLAGFVTHSTQMPEDGERATELYARWAGNCLPTFKRVCEEKKIVFLGYFHCQGAPTPQIATFIHNTIVTDAQEWETYIANVSGHPDDEDFRKVKVFVHQVLTLCPDLH